MHESLLIVEDDATIRITVAGFLRNCGFDVDTAENGKDALALARAKGYHLALLDLHLPDQHGLEVLAELKTIDERLLVVIMTAYPEIRTAVDALKTGAYDYINKPFDLEDLLELLRRALEARRLRHEVAWRRAQSGGCAPDGMVGTSPAFQKLLETTSRIAAAGRVPTLILGETGTGKEQIARAVHCQSPRSEGPWISVNCSALPEGLMESEMFGHEKGAFTDAKNSKSGLLELADGGTLFLDEIGDLSLALQPKLLRAIETQIFRRVGGNKEIRVDVRIVAATHRNLPEMVAHGAFREDLYYRLNVGTIEVPPLRARQDDILPLAHYFLARVATEVGRPAPMLAPAVESLLLTYAWPGNVRELRNVMERATLLCTSVIGAEHLPYDIAASASGQEDHRCNELADLGLVTLADVERAHILHTLAACHDNKSRAAELLGITRPTLRNKLKEYGIAHDDGS